MKNLISIESLTTEQFNTIVTLAEDMSKQPDHYSNSLKGKMLGMYFQKPSTRMRFSLETGMSQLGGNTSFFKTSDTHLSRGESIADTARVISGFFDIIAVRSQTQQDIVDFSDFGSIPVVNAMSAMHYPVMALTTLFTLKQHFGKVNGLNLTFVGDGNNICHSLLQACPLAGINISVISPEMYEPNPEIIQKAQNSAEKAGTNIVLSHSTENIKNSDVIFTDVWTSMGMEDEEKERFEAFGNYKVTKGIVEKSGKDPVILHAMPVRRGEEIDAELVPQSLIFKNAGNMLYISKAILHYFLKGGVDD